MRGTHVKPRCIPELTVPGQERAVMWPRSRGASEIPCRQRQHYTVAGREVGLYSKKLRPFYQCGVRTV